MNKKIWKGFVTVSACLLLTACQEKKAGATEEE